MMMLLSMLSALPMGDDTPVLLYSILAVVALVLLVGSIVLGKLTRKK